MSLRVCTLMRSGALKLPRIMAAFALLALTVGTRAKASDEGPSDSQFIKGEAKARLQNVEQLLNDWDIDGAAKELEAAEKVAPKDVEPIRYFRGRIAFERGHYADAVKELEAAGVHDKPGSWLRLVKDTARITEKYESKESDHFVFTYPPGRDAVLVPWALEALESQAKALDNDLGFAPKEKVRVEIVSSGRELAAVSTLTLKQIRDTGTIAICKFNKLMVTSPKALVHGYDWLDTLAHEYVHYAVSNVSKNTVPIWLHEGLAKYLESRWRGPYGGAMTPSTLALLGTRVRKNTLVPFEKMHPSMALLPTAEDAATAFAEVYFAVDLMYQKEGTAGLRKMLALMGAGETDQRAVEHTFGAPFPAFEKAWLAHVKKQPFPKELIPPSLKDRKELAETKDKDKKRDDFAFGEFREVEELEARRWAHLGELMRERDRPKAAAEHFSLAVAAGEGPLRVGLESVRAHLARAQALRRGRGRAARQPQDAPWQRADERSPGKNSAAQGRLSPSEGGLPRRTRGESLRPRSAPGAVPLRRDAQRRDVERPRQGGRAGVAAAAQARSRLVCGAAVREERRPVERRCRT